MGSPFEVYFAPIQWNSWSKQEVQSLPQGYVPGTLTFNAEGSSNPNSPYFSRIPHWPEGASGVTIGRGYDIKLRTQEEVFSDLINAGVDPYQAEALSYGAGLEGSQAKEFVKEIKHNFLPISEEAEINLFNQIYPEYIARAEAKASDPSVVKKYGYTDWETLHPGIKEVLVDMTYQGQYRASTRELIQPAVVANDIALFTFQMQSPEWPYPKDNRYRARIEFLNSML